MLQKLTAQNLDSRLSYPPHEHDHQISGVPRVDADKIDVQPPAHDHQTAGTAHVDADKIDVEPPAHDHQTAGAAHVDADKIDVESRKDAITKSKGPISFDDWMRDDNMEPLTIRWPVHDADKDFFHRLCKPRSWISSAVIIFLRKLCIYKGVFPREPKKKFRGNHQTYYHLKDVSFIRHDPILEDLRAKSAYRKKIIKAKAKRNKELADILKNRQPEIKLDRLVRERYPHFIDALRDLDDPLTLVHLFAALPGSDRLKIEVKRVHNCRKHASVRACIQAEVEGQKITWLTPHGMQQVLPDDDVVYDVLLSFLEFYETLLAFVNFKLYHSINVKYPPILDPQLEASAAELYALARYFDANSRPSEKVEATQEEESELRLAQLQHQLPSNEPGALMQLVKDAADENEEDEDTKECKNLFKNMRFFLSREVPRESMLFVIPAFGGTVSWEGEGAPFSETDQSITHQIVDRPTQGHVYLSREYVQPQWVYDCVNTRIILPTEAYMVGRVPPPHLSPFVDNEEEGYVPDYAETIKRLKSAAKNEILPMPGMGKENLDDPQNLLAEGYISRAEAIEAAERKQKMMTLEKQYHDELKMELDGFKYSSSVSDATKQKSDEDMETGEEPLPDVQQISTADMSKLLMSRKKRGLYEAMKKGQERKKAHVDLLKQRKKKIEAAEKFKKN
ncbi:Pescadillo-like [Citrus sinensis]|uniref:Pescadillo-like n=1 Tax=Citrus sinensis TaxID=2711 RepID=A0ACB8MZC8_CITSI|nr:Pescadillo-like [Citrus sinensis]